jgi:hypothetical protein
MGGSQSKEETFLQQERRTWQETRLNFNAIVRQTDLPKIDKFGPNLRLCSVGNYMYGVKYFHYFVTDNTWTIEFGGGELRSAIVTIHSMPKVRAYEVMKLKNTEDVRARMKQLVGLTSYSMMLRNCEHVSKYICTGTWASAQTTQSSGIFFYLFKALSKASDIEKRMNVLPRELKPKLEVKTIYPGMQPVIRYHKSLEYLTQNNNDHVNILVLGKTGVGKSRVVNLLFNKSACASEQSAASITRSVQIVQGSSFLDRHAGVATKKTINVFDTVGLLDTKLSTTEVFQLTKRYLRSQVLYLDAIILVVQNPQFSRVSEAEEMKRYLSWLVPDESHIQDFTLVSVIVTFSENIRENPPKIEKCKTQIETALGLNFDDGNYFANEEKNGVNSVFAPMCQFVGLGEDETANTIEGELARIKLTVFRHREFTKAKNPRRLRIEPQKTCTIL